MEESMDYRIDMSKESVWHFISATPYAKQYLIYLQETGLFLTGPGYYTTIHKLDAFSIKLTLSGRGVLLRDGRQYELSRGDFFWIDCGEPAHFQTENNAEKWDILWLRFSGVGVRCYYDFFKELNNNCPVGHLPDNSPVQQKMEKLLHLHQGHSDMLLADIRADNLMTQVISGLLEAVAGSNNLPAPPPIIYSVQEYLMEHFAKSITLDELSERFNLSKYYLQRTFTRYVGLSPRQYQLNVRLSQAKKLLRTTNTPINMIAYQVGFENTSSFITAFRKNEGITPLKYRTDWSDVNVFG